MDVYMARQPIFDRNNSTYAYELLFRGGENNSYDANNDDLATIEVIKNTFYILGIQNVTNGKKAFINFTEDLIKNDIVSMISPDIVVIEVLENVKGTQEVFESCRKFKEKGYIIALDDFLFENGNSKLISLADIIKVDFKLTRGIERKNIVSKLSNRKIKFLAEKVETYEEFQEALKYGYSYFQGYYFSKPVVLSGKDISPMEYVITEIIKELGNPEFNIKKLEKLILKDVSISYRLLKLVNSSAFRGENEVKSIRQAIMLLGETEIKKWLYIAVFKNVTSSKPNELLDYALLRAKFAENIVNKISKTSISYDAYMLGMMSLLDAMLDISMEDIMKEMSLPQEVKEALCGKENFFKHLLDLVVGYQEGDWKKVNENLDRIDISCENLAEAYLTAIDWVQCNECFY
ncbi:HDOD domain-containing protein [Clostridium sp. 19966]|uniref:EAL and HDOD domain-containing protein n=1 Tax=Clostridium sp. 19966 TaxID=2768166 RepID=UPI0028DE48D2|nr:HDOD domain-containing protein [Clostridium sp. 19966]MDT8715188.1 HDOD domain-containing protein [Clostridium sp. 19966]